MRDEAVFGGLCVAFAWLLVAHLGLVLGLSRRPPRWRAVVALFALPLAPIWGRAAGMHVRAVAWVVGACAYVWLLWLANH